MWRRCISTQPARRPWGGRPQVRSQISFPLSHWHRSSVLSQAAFSSTAKAASASSSATSASPASPSSSASPSASPSDDSAQSRCPPPLSAYFPQSHSSDPALFARYVDCFHQRAFDAKHLPAPAATSVSPTPGLLPAASSSSSDFPPAPSASSLLVMKEHEIYANQDCPLQHVTWYGFDFDYTLASYGNSLGHRIYEEAKFHLIQRLGYPASLARCSYDPTFPIRGLHFDDRTGFILKLDQFGKIQLETVHRGRGRVPVDEIVRQYSGITVNKEYEEERLHLMADLFCLPEICLLADVIQCFLDSAHDFSPDYVYRDVFKAIQYTHTSGKLHDAIIAKPSDYLEANPDIGVLLRKLRAAGKKIFLLTNSSFNFVDAGMRFMLGFPPPTPAETTEHSRSVAQDASPSPSSPQSSWLELFDVCIFNARKPHFWSRKNAHFRLIDQRTGALSFKPVKSFQRGAAYTDGSLEEFERMTGASGSSVIYCGDNTAADLVSPSESGLWKTVAVMKEIAHEVRVMSSLAFRLRLRELLELEALIDYGQRLDDAGSKRSIEELKTRRKAVKHELLQMFNPHFGSAFRTASHRTKLFFEVSRYADVYCSAVTNLLHYPLHFCFYAKRSFFPHEIPYEAVMQTAYTDTEPERDDQSASARPPQPEQGREDNTTGSEAVTGAAEAGKVEAKKKRGSTVGDDGRDKDNPMEQPGAREEEKIEQLGQ